MLNDPTFWVATAFIAFLMLIFFLGVIKNVAGIDLKIDIPSDPDIHLKWSEKSTIDSMFNELVKSIQNLQPKELDFVNEDYS